MPAFPFSAALWPGGIEKNELGLALPNLADFSSTSENIRLRASECLFNLVDDIVRCYKFLPQVVEFAYLSDFRGNLEITLDSFVAATELYREYVRFSDDAPYRKAIKNMIDLTPSGQPGHGQTIAGHPNLWQTWNHRPRVGYVHFPMTEASLPAQVDKTEGPYDIGQLGFTRRIGSNSVFRAGDWDSAKLALQSSSHDSLKIVEYTEHVESTFRRFCGWFLYHVRETLYVDRFSATSAALNNGYFLGIPFVRQYVEADQSLITALRNYGLQPSLGAILLLFIDGHNLGKDKKLLDKGLSDLARALYAVLTAMGIKEATERAQRQSTFVRGLGRRVHDAGNVIASMQPSSIQMVFTESPERFKSGDWDRIICKGAVRDFSKEEELRNAVSRLITGREGASKSLGLLEFRTLGSLLRVTYQQQGVDANIYTELIQYTKEFLSRHSDSAVKYINKERDLELTPDDDLTLTATLPQGYLGKDFLFPIVHEMLLNCLKYGLETDGKVNVHVSTIKTPSEAQSAENKMLWDFEFILSNKCDPKKPVTDQGKYEGFLEQVTVSFELENDTFRQRLVLRPFMRLDSENREIGFVAIQP